MPIIEATRASAVSGGTFGNPAIAHPTPRQSNMLILRSIPAKTPRQPAKRGAVFFDRDGCLNEDTGYVYRWADFRWLPGAIEAVKLVNDAGWLAFVVTNQSGIARGYYRASDVELLHARMAADLAKHGARIDGFRYCPHHPNFPAERPTGACACRKPAPGMILDLMKAWNVDPGRAFMVGDRDGDVAAARAGGIPGFLVPPGNVLATIRREVRRRNR